MNSKIIVKAHFNGDIRRFQSQALWTVFSKDLQALFSFDSHVVIQYRDDENDMCQISSQLELEFAASQFSTLQVFITKPAQVQIPVVEVPHVLVNEECSEQLTAVPALIRGDRLGTRLATIQKKLESPTLPAHRRAKLMIQKSKIEEAILRTPVEVPKQQEVVPVEHSEQTRKCRGRRNPSDRLLAIDQALSNPNLPQKRMERLQQQKAKLEAKNSESAPVASPAPQVLAPLRGPAARLAAIEKLLAQPDLHPRRVEKLTEKKAKLQEFILQKASNDSAALVVAEASPCRGPETRLAAISKMLESKDLPPHRLQKLICQKSKIEQRILERAEAGSFKNCRRGRRDQDLGCQQKPRGARLVVKRK